jgi:nucleoside-diphosphate-sugar epimerase
LAGSEACFFVKGDEVPELVITEKVLQKPLVTGAGGFIGSHLVRELLNRSDTQVIYCIDLPNSKRLKEFENNPRVKVIELNLNSESSIDGLPNDATCVFALAALNGTSRFYSKPYTVFESSIFPTLNVIRKYGELIPIVYSSSSEVYASTVTNFGGAIPTSESVIPSIESIHNPRWSYAAAKLAGEVAINSAAIEFGTNCSIVRYHNVYGPDMGSDHFIPDFVDRAKSGVFEVIGAFESRAFLNVLDAVQGTIAALYHAKESVPIYHLGSNQELRILDAAQIILDEMGLGDKEINLVPSREGSVARRVSDSAKAKEVLKWESKIDFRAGIRNYLDSEAS